MVNSPQQIAMYMKTLQSISFFYLCSASFLFVTRSLMDLQPFAMLRQFQHDCILTGIEVQDCTSFYTLKFAFYYVTALLVQNVHP